MIYYSKNIVETHHIYIFVFNGFNIGFGANIKSNKISSFDFFHSDKGWAPAGYTKEYKYNEKAFRNALIYIFEKWSGKT